MKLTQTEKVMIYAAALQGALINPETNYVMGQPVGAALHHGDQLIKELESRTEETSPLEPITD